MLNFRVLSVLFSVLKPVATMPGDGGKAVHIPESMKDRSKDTFKINQFNLIASDMMSLNRTLPDYRLSQ